MSLVNTTSSSTGLARTRPRWKFDHLASPTTFLAFGILHFALALLYRQLPVLGVVHVAATLAIGLLVTLRQPHRVMGFVAYIAGAELLWRMNSVPVPYETGKLGSLLLLAVALLCTSRATLRSQMFLLAGALYLPSIVLTIERFGYTESARAAISFHLTGPILLAVGAASLSALNHRIDLQRLLATFCVPVLGIAAFVLFSTLTAEEIRYTTESNFQTSGGFGPNQISLMMAFGAVALLVLTAATRGLLTRLLILTLAGSLVSLSVFTFSRTGLYCAVGSALMLTTNLVVDRKRGLRLVLAIATLFFVGQIVVFPKLDQTTGGALGERFSETSPSTRVELMKSDLEMFAKHPLLGVGPGVSRFERRNPSLVGHTAHTEYTRALAEHGILGLIAMLIVFGGWALQFTGRWRDRWSTSLALAAGFASLLALTASAVRVAAIPFFLLLAFTLHRSGSRRVDRRPEVIDAPERIRERLTGGGAQHGSQP